MAWTAAFALLVSAAGVMVWWGTAGDRGEARPVAEVVDLGHPAPPVPLGADSEFVDTEVLDGGGLLVTHWLRRTAPMDRVTLEVPAGSGLTAGDVDVDDLTVIADGVNVAAPQADDAGWGQPLPGARELYLQYRLTGVSQGSGSVEGRALVTLTALTLDVDGEPLTRTQVFSGANVLALACLAPGGRSTPTPCGSLVNDTWTLRSAAGSLPDTVIAQLDLTSSAADR